MNIKQASWKKGKKIITGIWRWNWASQRFIIQLDKKCKISGNTIIIETSGEHPNFNGWKLVE